MSATTTVPTDDATKRGEGRESDHPQDRSTRWTDADIEVIRRTVAKGLDDAELAVLLRVAEEYGLDPRLEEVSGVKFDGPDGPTTIFAGRNGLLKAARNRPQGQRRYRHMESAVVRANDLYAVEVNTEAALTDPTGNGGKATRIQHLQHRREGMGSEQRGAIVGAWAMVWVDDEEFPWFAEATWEDYGEVPSQMGNDGGRNLWVLDGTGNPEAMMLKVPQSIALRMACGLSGLYSSEELDKRLRDDGRGRGKQDVSGAAAPGGAAVQWPAGERGVRLRELVKRCNELTPRSWPVPKLAMNINGKTDEELNALEVRLRAVVHEKTGGAEGAPEVVVPPEPREVGPTQGPLADALLRVMVVQHHEGIRRTVQARLEELRSCIPDAEGKAQAPDTFGFASEDDVIAEVERLEEALRDATNGGPTMQEVIDAEAVEVPSWDDELEAEYQELRLAKADLDKAKADTDDEQVQAMLDTNLADVNARLEELTPQRPADEEDAAS